MSRESHRRSASAGPPAPPIPARRPQQLSGLEPPQTGSRQILCGQSQGAEDGEQVAESDQFCPERLPLGLEPPLNGGLVGPRLQVGFGEIQNPTALLLDFSLDHGIHGQRYHDSGSRLGEEGLMVLFRKGFTRGPIQAAIQRLREKDVKPHKGLGKLDMTGWSGWCNHGSPHYSLWTALQTGQRQNLWRRSEKE